MHTHPQLQPQILNKLPSNYIRHWGFAQSKSEHEQHQYRIRTQILNELKEYCQKADNVSNHVPKQDTFSFEWKKNDDIKQKS
ncbi:unnamed protein product [Adineta steineri]|uniref:Uncharacterized protein n=1 Tax=Adineta steineri TaxID=433720 RepID=A0A814TX79_9BILA|nr:unnamed protein product [Adineta steineri]CAF3869210.1 unnamed protein product [Adineta steineri]